MDSSDFWSQCEGLLGDGAALKASRLFYPPGLPLRPIPWVIGRDRTAIDIVADLVASGLDALLDGVVTILAADGEWTIPEQ